MKKFLIWTGAAIVAVVILGWLVLASPIFSGVRSGFAEGILSRELGRPVEVRDDLRITLGGALHVSAEGVSIPSTSMAELDLATLDSLSFDLSARELLGGKVALSNLQASGGRALLIVDDSGAMSWASADEGSESTAPSETSASPMNIFSDRTIRLQNTRVLYQDARNGLDLDLMLADLALAQESETSPVTVEGTGDLNGEGLTLSATMGKDTPLSAEIAFEHITLTATGSTDQGSTGPVIALSADVRKLSQLLDALKMQKPIDGTAQVSALLTVGDPKSRIDKLDVQVALDGGQSVAVTGNIGELGNPEDVSLTTRIRLYPEDNEPARTEWRRDVKLIAVDMVIDSAPGRVAQRSMKIVTNGFTIDTAGEGPPPISVGQLSRSEDGELRIGKINLRIGKPESPFLIIDGSAEHALALEGINATATLDMPATDIIAPQYFKNPNVLGRLTGAFTLSGNGQKLTLSNLDASTVGTDIWSLDVGGHVENALKFQDLTLDVKVGVPSTSTLLEAMSLKPVSADPTYLGLSVESRGTDWDAKAEINVDTSTVTLDLALDDATDSPVVTGEVASDLIKIEHVRHIVDAAVELRRLRQPPEDVPDANEAEAEPGIFRDVSLRPLGQAVLISGMDLDVDVNLAKIEGAKGVSSIHSELKLDGDYLSAGPLKVEYGGGDFEITGGMDLSQEEHILELKGTAGGWQLDGILGLLQFKKAAGGSLYAGFEIAGPVTSARDFISQMNGSAHLSMHNGFIDSQLLDLAGLGILPWLFSQDRGQVAQITCVQVPASINNGVISTSRTAVETEQVQIVVSGNINLDSKTLDVQGQPRKIGEPLARSPWPFTISGSFEDPRIKVKDGPKRLKRTDGADTMPANRKACVPDILQLQ